MTASSEPNNSEINTGGGTYTGGDVNAGNDFVGRDQINNYSTTYNVTYPPEAAVPNQLPRRTTQHFVGRDQPIDWIKDNLKPGATLVVIGPGGMGKTTLAIQAINEMAQDGGKLYELFPDGIIFHTFYGRPEIDLCFANILAAYGVEAKGDVEQLTRQALGGKRPLLILDGCEDVKEKDGLRKVLDVVGNSGVLITTRAKSQGRLGPELDLERLEVNEAEQLLQVIAGKDYEVSIDVKAEICYEIGYLPLGVDIAGNYLRETGESATDYLNWLKKSAVEALDYGETRRNSIYHMIRQSAERIDDIGKDILVVLGQMAYLSVSKWMIEELMAWDRRKLEIYLREMERFGLIKYESGKIVCTHALVHSYARDQHRGENWGRAETLIKVFEWMNENYRVWQKSVPPHFDQCDSFLFHAIALVERLEKKEMWAEANSLIWAIGPNPSGYLALQGHYIENILALKAGIRVCKRSENKRDENIHLTHLALILRRVGRIKESISCFEQGLEISREIEDQETESAQLGNLGNSYRHLGEVKKSIELYKEAIAISHKINDQSGVASQLGNLGNAYYTLERFEEAINFFEQALNISRIIGDRLGESKRLTNLGNVFSRLSRIKEAIEVYELALIITREIGNRQGEGNLLGN
ncbi:MAG: tetratricopeptide repeat protein, partial [Chloroflexota bacterium]